MQVFWTIVKPAELSKLRLEFSTEISLKPVDESPVLINGLVAWRPEVHSRNVKPLQTRQDPLRFFCDRPETVEAYAIPAQV